MGHHRVIGRAASRPSAVLCAAVAALLLAGCGGDTAEETGEPGEVAVDLVGQNDANITGARAVFSYASASRTTVTIDGLDGSERGAPGPNPARLVRGSCSHPGAVAFRLEPLTGAVSETSIDIGLPELYAGDYAVQVLFSSEGEEPMACGEMPDEAP